MINLKLRHISPTCPNLGRNSDGQRLQWGSLPDGRLPRYPPPQGRRKLLFEVNGVGRCILRPAQGRRQSGRKSVCRPSADLRKVTGAL